MIAAGHPLTAEAAAQVLRSGGNAFDAVVAAGFASAVAEPWLTGLGGGGFLLARPTDGNVVLFDFFVNTPGLGRAEGCEPDFFPATVHFGHTEQVFNVGRASVAVPGNLKGYLHVQARLGRLPLEEVLSPAVRMAQGGIPLGPRQAYLNRILQPILTLSAEGSSIYAPKGRPVREGERVFNPELAHFLGRLLGEGEEALYGGRTAQQIAADMRQGSGLLSAEDLAAYRVIERDPLCSTYRRHRVLTNPPPSRGGSLLELSLGLLESQSLSELEWQSSDHLALLAGVMMEVDELRGQGYLTPGDLSGSMRAAFASRLRRFTRGTTQVSIADADGNAASMTTSNGEGSGYVVPGTGIMLNNMMGEDDLHPSGFHCDPAGQRVASMMSPTLVLEGERVHLVIGSGGSKRIRTALFQVISHIIDFGVPLSEAVSAPRIHWDGEHIQVEPGLPERALEALRTRAPVNVWSERNLYFGGVNAVTPGQEAAADPRREGSALILEEK